MTSVTPEKKIHLLLLGIEPTSNQPSDDETVTLPIEFSSTPPPPVSGGGGGLFLVCEDFGRMFDNLFPACTFFPPLATGF